MVSLASLGSLNFHSITNLVGQGQAVQHLNSIMHSAVQHLNSMVHSVSIESFHTLVVILDFRISGILVFLFNSIKISYSDIGNFYVTKSSLKYRHATMYISFSNLIACVH